MPRPTKLTKEIQDKIVTYISRGAYIETAAAAAGISKDTLYRWLKRGAKEKSGIYREFSDAIEKADAVAELYILQQLQQLGDKAWQAHAWRLERRWPERWGQRYKVEDLNPTKEIRLSWRMVNNNSEDNS